MSAGGNAERRQAFRVSVDVFTADFLGGRIQCSSPDCDRTFLKRKGAVVDGPGVALVGDHSVPYCSGLCALPDYLDPATHDHDDPREPNQWTLAKFARDYSLGSERITVYNRSDRAWYRLHMASAPP
jgi:hypothetical protein